MNCDVQTLQFWELQVVKALKALLVTENGDKL